jgi:sugar porter (SP) family MFS transporter
MSARAEPPAANTAGRSPGHHFDHRYVVLLSTVAALGGLLFGYDWVVIGGAKPFYEAFFHLTHPSQQAWAMSCALAGCFAGAGLSGVLSEELGRKRSLLIAAVVFLASSLGTGVAASFGYFAFWRICGGVAIGLASGLSPVYIAEVAPAEVRGKLVCLNELTIVIGILLAQTMNWLIAQPVPAGATAAMIEHSWNAQNGWRWMFAATAVPSCVFLVGMLLVPESPRWLARRERWRDAERVLDRIAGPEYAQSVINEIRASLEEHRGESELRRLREPRMLQVLAIGVALAVLQQWCGINVIFNYAQEVFADAGYSLSSMLFNILITGVTMLVFTFIAIGTVERWGRRVLMLVGCAGLASFYTVLGALYSVHAHGWPMMVLVVAAIACYAMTLAPVTWVILAEIFPNRIRGAAMAIAAMSLWAACFVLTYTFPLLDASLGTARTFWIYAAVCLLGFFFVKAQLPETRQKSLEEIQQFWEKN